MIHKHPSIRKSFGKKWKWNIEFFCKIGLIPSAWHYYKETYPTYTIEVYMRIQTEANKKRHERYIEKLKEKGIEYYTQARIRKIASTGYVFAK